MVPSLPVCDARARTRSAKSDTSSSVSVLCIVHDDRHVVGSSNGVDVVAVSMLCVCVRVIVCVIVCVIVRRWVFDAQEAT